MPRVHDVLGATLALAVCTLVACDRFDTAPREVASSFWSAVAAGDFAKAATLSTDDEAAVQTLAREVPLRDVKLGEILHNESTALVETRAVYGDRNVELTFNTHLTRSEGTWRVDAKECRREVRRAALAASFEGMQDAVSESADMLVDEFEERALEASEALRDALDELKDALRGDEGS